MAALERRTVMGAVIRVGLAIAALVLIAGVSYRVTRMAIDDSAIENVRQVSEGDVLENLGLLKIIDEKTTDVVPLHAAFGGECAIMIFFHSACPYCEEMAPKWSEIGEIATPAGDVPVAWTAASASDTGAAGFIHRHGLAQPWYALGTDEDRRSIGVQGWPTLYLISADGRFEGEIESRDPERVALAATQCLETSSLLGQPGGSR